MLPRGCRMVATSWPCGLAPTSLDLDEALQQPRLDVRARLVAVPPRPAACLTAGACALVAGSGCRRRSVMTLQVLFLRQQRAHEQPVAAKDALDDGVDRLALPLVEEVGTPRSFCTSMTPPVPACSPCSVGLGGRLGVAELLDLVKISSDSSLRPASSLTRSQPARTAASGSSVPSCSWAEPYSRPDPGTV